MNDFFTKVKHLVLQLKQCKVEKEDNQLILAILSKLGPDYFVFVSSFHMGNLTTPNWKIPSSRSSQMSMISLFIWGSLDPQNIKLCLLQGQKIRREKRSRIIQRPNWMLQILKKRTSIKNSLSAQRNTRTKETKEKIKSRVLIVGRDSTLNMPA